MEKKEEIKTLDNFLSKVKQLRGFGDMNSYRLVNEYKKLNDSSLASEQAINEIIEDLSAPETWYIGKKALENTVIDAINLVKK